jgi:hypothetical protein
MANSLRPAQRKALSSTAQIAAAERLAETLVVAFGQCDEAGRPLTDLQKIDILSTAFAAFDGYRAELERQLRFEQVLVELGRGCSETAGARQWRTAS